MTLVRASPVCCENPSDKVLSYITLTTCWALLTVSIVFSINVSGLTLKNAKDLSTPSSPPKEVIKISASNVLSFTPAPSSGPSAAGKSNDCECYICILVSLSERVDMHSSYQSSTVMLEEILEGVHHLGYSISEISFRVRYSRVESKYTFVLMSFPSALIH